MLKFSFSRQALSLALLPLLSGMVLLSVQARADQYDIAIWQINPKGDVHELTCSDQQAACNIFMPLVVGTREKEMKAVIAFKPGGADISFEWQGHRFATSGYNGDNFYIPLGSEKTSINKIKLYIPNPLAQAGKTNSLYRLPVQRLSHTVVAELEISIHAGVNILP